MSKEKEILQSFGTRKLSEMVIELNSENGQLENKLAECTQRLVETEELRKDEQGFYWDSCGDRLGESAS